MGKSWKEFREESIQFLNIKEDFKEEIKEWIDEYKRKIVRYKTPNLYSKGEIKVLKDLEEMIAEM